VVVTAHATSAPIETFEQRVERHRNLLRKRRFPMSAEHMPPVGQAALWYGDVIQCVSQSGREVAKQLARLCGEDSKITFPWRSLADAVGRTDKAGRLNAYTEGGAARLIEAGWLDVTTVGQKSGARTTWSLLQGDPPDYLPWWADGDVDDLEEWAA
jgi:hypothetical protein